MPEIVSSESVDIRRKISQRMPPPPVFNTRMTSQPQMSPSLPGQMRLPMPSPHRFSPQQMNQTMPPRMPSSQQSGGHGLPTAPLPIRPTASLTQTHHQSGPYPQQLLPSSSQGQVFHLPGPGNMPLPRQPDSGFQGVTHDQKPLPPGIPNPGPSPAKPKPKKKKKPPQPKNPPPLSGEMGMGGSGPLPLVPPPPLPKPKSRKKPSQAGGGGGGVKKLSAAALKLQEDQLKYTRKNQLLKRCVKALVFKNAALCDEVARLNQRIHTVMEERKVLLKRIFHHERLKQKKLAAAQRKQAAQAQKAEEAKVSTSLPTV